MSEITKLLVPHTVRILSKMVDGEEFTLEVRVWSRKRSPYLSLRNLFKVEKKRSIGPWYPARECAYCAYAFGRDVDELGQVRMGPDFLGTTFVCPACGCTGKLDGLVRVVANRKVWKDKYFGKFLLSRSTQTIERKVYNV